MTTFAPAPARNSTKAILRSQIRMELVLTARRGEAVVLAMGVPLLVLLGAGLTDVTNVPGGDRLAYVVPGVLALTVMSTAFTGQAITTGYERSYGVLKELLAAGGGVEGYGEHQCRAVGKFDSLLHRAFAKGTFSYQIGALVVGKSSSSQLGGSCGATIDQDSERCVGDKLC